MGADFVLVRSGKFGGLFNRFCVQVYRGDSPLLVGGTPVIVEPGSLLGETAPFLGQPRNASIVTLDECEVLAIRGQDFRRIVERSPQLFCQISRTVKQRAAA